MTTEETAGSTGELFMRLSRRLRSAYAEQLAPLGLTHAQARALEIIAKCEEPPRMVDLAHRLRVVPRAITPLVDALEEADLVRRRVDPANRRSTLLELTDHGRATREVFGKARAAAAEGLFAALTEPQLDELHALMEKIDSAGR